MDTTPVPTPAALARPRGSYDRHRWEAAVLASGLQRLGRHLALTLAHLAGPAGQLPAGGRHDAGHLASVLRLDAKRVRLTLTELEQAGWIHRPDIRTWEPRQMLRPITLTLPADRGTDA
ncbi:hypothetical protein OG866_26985 [Streptomyces sp. NBC_00663]|uniref:hypothetical protein n=1 Tax=Streptomyces sp. NBC_00663 TaxID=2975801 RepID=UPI002E350D39|nr:hypothetical protein [Streptomyces sp. NBC_00663]